MEKPTLAACTLECVYVMRHRDKLIKVLNGAKAKHVFKEQELEELIDAGILVQIRDAETKIHMLRIKPSIRRLIQET